VPVLEPHEIRGSTIASADLQDLADPIDVANGPAMNMKTVTDLGLHGSHLHSSLNHFTACRARAGRESPDVTPSFFRWRIETPFCQCRRRRPRERPEP
jgi:hypothetical protein